MTTTDAPALVDFVEFHRIDLPERLAGGNGALAFDDVADIGPLALQVDGRAYTYVPVDGTIEVREGDDDARSVVELDVDSFAGLVHDLETAPGLLYRGKVTKVRGNVLRFVRWEAALRAMYHGRPIFDATAPPPMPHRAFTLDSDPAEMGEFLAAMGYLHVQGVFAADEIAAMVEASERLADRAVPGDEKSWWGKDADGNELLTRVINAGTEPVFGALREDERLLGVVATSEFELIPRGWNGPEGATVLWKLPGVAEGLGDLPWHRDCGMGGHATMCPLLIATVCLTDGSAAAGELRVLPGSWKASVNFIDPSDPDAPEGIGLATTAGDVTFHYSDVMHASLPPTSTEGPFRVSALVAFVPPEAHVHHADETHYNDPLLKNPDGQVEHLDRIVDRL